MIRRDEFPRPDFVREKWTCLNGVWEFDFDPSGSRTIQEGLTGNYSYVIRVPFCYQSKLSGIGATQDCAVVWYRRQVTLELKDGAGAAETQNGAKGPGEGAARNGKNSYRGRILLKFGAVDEEAQVWVNGIFVGSHKGGYVPFSLDITQAARNGENTIVVRVKDECRTDQPRGKQTWTGEPFACWYTPVTGIWQPVWLEYVPENYLERIKITPDEKRLTAAVEVFAAGGGPLPCQIHMYMEDPSGCTRDFGTHTLVCQNGYGRTEFAFDGLGMRPEQLLWSVEHPNLIQADIITGESKESQDHVSTYFGMRSIAVRDGRVLLNSEVLFQRLVLDQGYWEESLLTPPSKEALVKDLELVRAMGFNGVRKHQKIEDPLFYYYADKMGLLVWGELPSAYIYNDNMVENSVHTMLHFIERDFNHPCIITWVPVNESWGVGNVLSNPAQQSYVRAMTWMIRAMDPTRLVSANDGWEQPECTDICAVHDYTYTEHTPEKFDKNWEEILKSSPDKRFLFFNGCTYGGQPVILSEYGGIAFAQDKEGWGYMDKVKDEDGFLKRLGAVTGELIDSGKFAGFCYTQLTDVQQEMNGLLTIQRNPKVPVDKLKKIFGR